MSFVACARPDKNDWWVIVKYYAVVDVGSQCC